VKPHLMRLAAVAGLIVPLLAFGQVDREKTAPARNERHEAPQAVYSDLGPDNDFSSNGWCVSGASGADCSTFAIRYIAAAFTPATSSILSSISLPLSNISGTNGAVIWLANNSSGGTPGTVLESWSVSNLPASSEATIALTSVTSKLNPALQAGQTYWLEVQPLAADTTDYWDTNNLGIGGGLQNINQSGWTALSGYGGQTQPAFSVIGIPGYSDFGPDNTFSNNGWCVSGASGASCTTFATRYIAAPFVLATSSILSSINLPLSNLSGTNGAVISLTDSASGGIPGTVLESWSVSNLPASSASSIAVTQVISKLSPALEAGQTYWLEVQPLADDTTDNWYTNSIGLGGGLQNINQGGWTALSGYSGQTLPAFNVVGSTAVASSFVPLTPCRVVDTRNASGALGGPSIASGTSRDFPIPSGSCNVPVNATAYSLNVTVVPQGPLGYLTIWPAGQPQPLASTLNSDGRIKANAAIVPAGSSGAVSVFATDTTDVVLDINGYFVPEGSSGALALYTLTPCRIADTRDSPAPLGGPSLMANSFRTFPILSSFCDVPSTAQAYSLNFTAVPAASLGYLTAWPTGLPQPYVSSLNDPTGTIAANAVILPAGTSGSVNVFTTDDTDLVIDANGYFAAPASGGLSLYTIQPCRVLDTRQSPGTPITYLAVNVLAGACGVPASAQAYVFNATVVPAGSLGFLTLWPDGQPQPLASTLNAVDGATTANMAIVPSSNGSIDAFASQSTHLILDISGYFAP